MSELCRCRGMKFQKDHRPITLDYLTSALQYKALIPLHVYLYQVDSLCKQFVKRPNWNLIGTPVRIDDAAIDPFEQPSVAFTSAGRYLKNLRIFKLVILYIEPKFGQVLGRWFNGNNSSRWS